MPELSLSLSLFGATTKVNLSPSSIFKIGSFASYPARDLFVSVGVGGDGVDDVDDDTELGLIVDANAGQLLD